MVACAAGRGAGVPGKRECMARKATLLGALLFVVAMAGMVVPAAGAEYKVGESVRWTIRGSPNYTAWSVSKTFRVGDTIDGGYRALLGSFRDLRFVFAFHRIFRNASLRMHS